MPCLALPWAVVRYVADEMGFVLFDKGKREQRTPGSKREEGSAAAPPRSVDRFGPVEPPASSLHIKH